MAGTGLARLLDHAGDEHRLRPCDPAGLGRFRRRTDRAWPRLYPVPGLCRLYGGRPNPGRRALREEPSHRGRPATALEQPVLRQTALRRADPVHWRAALPPDDGVDARRRDHLRAVLWARALPG